MAVNVSKFPEEMCVVYGEFLNNLKIANFYIGLNEKCGKFRIGKITFERSRVLVEVVRKGKKEVDCVSIELPPSISILPRSINGLKPTAFGWLFRIAFDRLKVDDAKYNNNSNFTPECVSCANNLISTEFSSSGLVEVSENELSTYFCHDHCHHSNQQQSPSVTIPLQVVSQGESVLIHRSALDPQRINVDTKHNVHCSRCHHVLGSIDHDSFHLHRSAVRGSNAHSFASFIKQLTTTNKLLIQSNKDETQSLLVWLMDTSLVLFHTKNNKTTAKNVCKVLYEIQAPANGVQAIHVEHNSLVALISTLVNSTHRLPVSWRSVLNFSVGYLNI